MIEIILLSIAQGITEFLPISSSAHLILISEFLNFRNENLTLDISLHAGSLMAVIYFFKKDIVDFIQNKALLIKIIVSSLPTLVVGFLIVKFNIIDHLRKDFIIALTTIIFAILLYHSDKKKSNKNITNDFTLKNSIYIGLFQILSLIPGVSRSGITITAARILNFKRIESAKISFLLSIPTLFAVSTYNIFKIVESKNLLISTNNILAIILSFAFSLITLKLFINFLKKFSFVFFVVYRVVLGIIILIYIYNG